MSLGRKRSVASHVALQLSMSSSSFKEAFDHLFASFSPVAVIGRPQVTSGSAVPDQLLIDHLIHVARVTLKHGDFLLFENPITSTVWGQLLPQLHLEQVAVCQVALFNWCAKWDKLTRWLTNLPTLRPGQHCNGKHERARFFLLPLAKFILS